jgi:hypothetical protein
MLLWERNTLLRALLSAESNTSTGDRADLFELTPNVTAQVHRWGGTSDGVLIEFMVRGTASGASVSWQSVDRLTVSR